jgi:hypothetical protein
MMCRASGRAYLDHRGFPFVAAQTGNGREHVLDVACNVSREGRGMKVG